MNETPPFRLVELVCLLLVVGIAAGVRVAYVINATAADQREPPFLVQGEEPGRTLGQANQPGGASRDLLVYNLREERWFGRRAPLSDQEEETADVAPGYPWLVSLAERVQTGPHAAALVRWVQCALGALTVLCYFFFARRAFGSLVVATLAGLLAAVYPFWVLNTAELADGVLATFLVAVVLVLGTRGSQVGGSFTSLLFGLGLAALALVRAALLPFAVAAFIWYLARCRELRQGWFAALLALLGFANGLAPWAVRNWQVFHEPIPIVDSAYLHLWMGNNPLATGATLDEATLRRSLPPDVLQQLLADENQPRRYARLGPQVVEQVADDPAGMLGHRINAGLCFLLGGDWLKDQRLVRCREGDDLALLPSGTCDLVTTLARGSLLAVLLLGALGWRWSAAWSVQARLAAIAVVWVPLPYLLSHAEALSGPRLPLDGVLLCYVAFALACLYPRFAARTPEEAAQAAKEATAA